MEENLTFPVRAFEALPLGLTPSSYVDFMLLLGDLKPTLRIHVADARAKHALEAWCRKQGYASASNASGYICLAKNKNVALRLQELDDSQEAHEYELGLLLGYPRCCCRKAAEVGENNIDEWERTMSQDAAFQRSPYCLIDPRGYTGGSSLISHIPCSPECEASLSIAKAAIRIVRCLKDNHHFRGWLGWFALSSTF